MLSRRSLLVGGLTALAFGRARDANATLVLPVTLTELVSESQHAVVATPGAATSRWETIGGRERIVTYTPLHIEYTLDGTSPASEVMVRTLGGRVGDIGQLVPGEAALRQGASSALFLEPVATAVFGVTAMAQGHYPILADEKGARRLKANTLSFSKLSPDAALVRLDGQTVVDVEKLVSQEVASGAR
ncbi:MAG TPA: hypothetical protein VHU80_19255 [Polyangiaceae bacterium]|jgi:hypothetical protein|nr:hypothetical protein [Polyangiaceae bacterium]